MTQSLFGMFVFPGFLFLCAIGVCAEYFDRIFHARMQNRKGPPWFQPVADFIKLSAKEDIIPEEADVFMFKAMPIVAVASAVTAVLYIPLWGGQALYSFEGDLIIVLYLLTIPTMTFFLAGWYSTSLYAAIGSVRTLTQLFSYEVPLYIAVLAPAVLANSWSLSGMTAYYASHPGYWLFNLPGLAVTMVILLGKLEKVPFDIPEAETEIVGGVFTEYTGRFLAFFRMAIDIETVVVASLVSSVFLPFGLGLPVVIGFVLYLAKIALVVAGVSFLRTIFARARIDQMVVFCWKYLAPAAMVQMLINLILKGVLPQ
ncbi:complex I subunit 1 family protein [Pelobacter propionicus]|uniref:NADH dehydrogenase subunit H n=1 Tax=Pelobacter propionicus (strain DSM 2379 / NBRC 103807 / OttBd1) TaxID=338966 RepID=A1ALK7_PELPD|nr:complex I subunit 1 family protein [Pelobacter propionicus]ABK98227.1 NADH dehydrogenase subunit H [Pelobacter propionicus DSM 2379]